MTHPLGIYLHAMGQTHASGQATDETSYYDALTGLLNSVGTELKPLVRAVLTLRNRGAGLPDGGLFTANQLRPGQEVSSSSGGLPARGAIEVKPLSTDVRKVAESEQVERYLGKYGQVLVTNYREFLLVGQGPNGRSRLLESYSIAADEDSFWRASRALQKTVQDHGDGLIGYLRRVMVRSAPITTPEDLAWVLASYAQEALRRVERAPMDALEAFKESLELALGIRFDNKKSIHFFHSTLVQTLFYGIFSSWVIWAKDSDPDAVFDWHEAAWTSHLPAVGGLFSEVATPRRIKSLDLKEVLDWTAEALARVDRSTFFSRFEDRFAIQYFYEPFLESFDPSLRKELGVWYTPPEIVHYIVERVDRVLREELGIEAGFADNQVYVLDPCAGTGSFLVEVLRRIERTLRESGENEFLSAELKKAATSRIFGFEILPAPFVVAHLQVGLFLQAAGFPLDSRKDERAGLYLTNSLVGWEPPEGPQKRLSFVELQEEREASDRVKRDTPVLVVLGNPPYNAYAGTSPDEELGLVDVYKKGLREVWKIKKFNLDELYSRFMRVAERQIAERSKRGIVCYISSYSYLSDSSFVVLRERLWSEFDKAWIDSLNGDSRETGKKTPDGLPDPSIFSTERNREGIQLGTVIGLFVKKQRPERTKAWRYRDFWGTGKREELVESLAEPEFDNQYHTALPERANQFNFRPSKVSADYYAWPSLTDLIRTEPSNGLMEKRGSSLISIDSPPLKARMQRYFDRSVSWESLAALGTGLTEDAAGYDARKTRTKAQREESYSDDRVVPYAARPFDHQSAYYSEVSPLWNRSRPALYAQLWAGNSYFVSRRHGSKSTEGPPFYWTSRLFDDSLLSLHATAFPIRVRSVNRSLAGFDEAQSHQRATNNYSDDVIAYLQEIGIEPENDEETASLLWLHCLAIGFAPKYLQVNADGIKQDWPRIPLPRNAELLRASAKLGKRLAALLDADQVPGITKAPLRPEIQFIGRLRRSSGEAFDPTDDLEIDQGWGRPQQGGVFPGLGRVVIRDYTDDEVDSIERGGAGLGMKREKLLELIGEQTCDVYLNAETFWSNVPENVWNYHLGGYQVIKKWLSYRETRILGRPITPDEAREVQGMARRLLGVLLMQPDLNENYRKNEHTWSRWPPARASPKRRGQGHT